MRLGSAFSKAKIERQDRAVTIHYEPLGQSRSHGEKKFVGFKDQSFRDRQNFSGDISAQGEATGAEVAAAEAAGLAFSKSC